MDSCRATTCFTICRRTRRTQFICSAATAFLTRRSTSTSLLCFGTSFAGRAATIATGSRATTLRRRPSRWSMRRCALRRSDARAALAQTYGCSRCAAGARLSDLVVSHPPVYVHRRARDPAGAPPKRFRDPFGHGPARFHSVPRRPGGVSRALGRPALRQRV
jgi:hypothetical protein